MELKFMDNVKTPKYYIDKILKDIDFCINNLNDVTIEEFNEDEVLSWDRSRNIGNEHHAGWRRRNDRWCSIQRVPA